VVESLDERIDQDEGVRRGLGAAIGISLVVGGTVFALKPFQMTISIPEAEATELGPIHADCKRPVVAAWNTGKKGQLALWAVTRGTDEAGYEVRSGQAPYCAGPARTRLALSLVATAAGALVLALTARPRSRR
jgi:hypothetical protein